jgi:hypothetical protein
MENREIDRLIAEKVMGWRDGTYAKGSWFPSTDIKDAWLIVEKLKHEEGYLFRLETGDVNDWKCLFSDFQDNYWAESDNAPLAICKATLKANGIII